MATFGRATRLGFLLALVFPLAISGSAQARPAVAGASDTVDDATLTLRVLEQMILGDARSWCELRIEDAGEQIPLRPGDTVSLRVYENDIAGDDLLWETDFEVTNDEVAANRIDRTFDCTSDFQDDVGGQSEIYAEAEVVKAECGFWCLYDRPETEIIEVAEVEDDDWEDDDTDAAARPLGLGLVEGSIGRDQDWVSLELAATAHLTLEALHDPLAGRLDMALFDAGGGRVAISGDDDDASRIVFTSLPAGAYTASITPRISDDYNFYDVRLLLDAAAHACTPAETEDQACGNCGTRTRTCSAQEQWGAFSDCEGGRDCSPGSFIARDCGRCGSMIVACTEDCVWVEAACQDEGACLPGATEDLPCAGGGVRTRECGADCRWSVYADCPGAECNDD